MVLLSLSLSLEPLCNAERERESFGEERRREDGTEGGGAVACTIQCASVNECEAERERERARAGRVAWGAVVRKGSG